jgi:hypothetical protein
MASCPNNPRKDLPGVKYCTDYRERDTYTGTKQALISAGIAKAEWFPRRLVGAVRVDGKPYMANNGKQRTKRTFDIDGGKLNHRPTLDGELWIVLIENERSRAEAEERKDERRQMMRRYATRRKQKAALAEYVEPDNSALSREVRPVPCRGRQFDIRGWCNQLGGAR